MRFTALWGTPPPPVLVRCEMGRRCLYERQEKRERQERGEWRREESEGEREESKGESRERESERQTAAQKRMRRTRVSE